MTVSGVTNIYSKLENQDVKIWIDGGWCVDALIGKQLRTHKDLDIAIEWKNVPKLRKVLSKEGYKETRANSKWNFVLSDSKGNEIDVHAFIRNSSGEVVDGIMYPTESLKGTGNLNSLTVRCITPKYMVEFLAPLIHKWPNKYVSAVSELCNKYNLDLPKEYLAFQRRQR